MSFNNYSSRPSLSSAIESFLSFSPDAFFKRFRDVLIPFEYEEDVTSLSVIRDFERNYMPLPLVIPSTPIVWPNFVYKSFSIHDLYMYFVANKSNEESATVHYHMFCEIVREMIEDIDKRINIPMIQSNYMCRDGLITVALTKTDVNSPLLFWEISEIDEMKVKCAKCVDEGLSDTLYDMNIALFEKQKLISESFQRIVYIKDRELKSYRAQQNVNELPISFAEEEGENVDEKGVEHVE